MSLCNGLTSPETSLGRFTGAFSTVLVSGRKASGFKTRLIARSFPELSDAIIRISNSSAPAGGSAVVRPVFGLTFTQFGRSVPSANSPLKDSARSTASSLI